MAQRTPRRKLSLEELRDIARQRRGDSDVQALLWEIKRLHDLLVTARDMTNPVAAVLDLTARETVLRRLEELLEDEPALREQVDSRYGKPKREPTTGYAQRRIAQVEQDELDEREAKRRARERR